VSEVADPAVFLDRDGTLIEEVGYPTRPEQIRILGGVARALVRLAAAGYRLIVITNQSAIARGLMSEEDLHRFHRALDEQLDLLGARVDAYYACPHHPDPGGTPRPDLAVDCDCRKPKPGLILRAAADLDINLARSWVVGDTWRDVAAGQAAGIRTVKLPAAPSLDGPRPESVQPPTAEAAGLDEAAGIILSTGDAGTEDIDLDMTRGEQTAAVPEAPVEAPAEVSEEAGPQPAEPAAEVPEAVIAAPVEAPVEGPPPEPEPPPAPLVEEAPVIASEKAVAPPWVRGTCARCGQDVPASDVASGAAGNRDGFLLCRECLARLPHEGGEGSADDAAALLRSILMEVRRLGRRRAGGSLGFLRLLAYLVQAGALFCGLVLGLVSEEKLMYLQIAILLQLLVVTLLLLERNS
jgi:D-glycero-D-manno-heptose 1,7-bisphosphate phosphatase